MGVSVYTMGAENINAKIIATGLPSGESVKAWRQGSYADMIEESGEYVCDVYQYGTYTITHSGSDSYVDVFVNSEGNHTGAF